MSKPEYKALPGTTIDIPYAPEPREWVEVHDDVKGEWVLRPYRGVLLDKVGGKLDEFPYYDTDGNSWRKMRKWQWMNKPWVTLKPFTLKKRKQK